MTSSICPGLLVDLRICPRTQQSQGLWPVPHLPRGIWKELIMMDMDESHLGLVDIGWWFHDRSLGYEWCRNLSSYMFLSFFWQWLRCESMCVNNGKLLRFLSDRLCAHMLLHSPVRIKWMAQLPKVYICCCFPVQIIQLPASPFVWFPVFLTHGFTPSWMLGDMDLKPTWYAHTSLNRNNNRTILSYFGAWIPKIMVWKKDFPFSTIYRDLFGVQFVFAGLCFRLRHMWDTFLNNIHRYDFGQKVRSSTSITSSTTSLTSFLGTANQNDVVGGLVWCRSKTCLSAFILSV